MLATQHESSTTSTIDDLANSLNWIADSIVADPLAEMRLAMYWLLPYAIEDVSIKQDYSHDIMFEHLLFLADESNDMSALSRSAELYHQCDNNIDEHVMEEANEIAFDIVPYQDESDSYLLETGYIQVPFAGVEFEDSDWWSACSEYTPILNAIGIHGGDEDYHNQMAEVLLLAHTLDNYGYETIGEGLRYMLDWFTSSTGNNCLDLSETDIGTLGIDYPHIGELNFVINATCDADRRMEMIIATRHWLNQSPDRIKEIEANYKILKEGHEYDLITWSESFRNSLNTDATYGDPEILRFWRDAPTGQS